MRSKKQKQHLRTFLVVKEVVMMCLVAVSLLLLALEHFEQLSHEQLLLVGIYEVVVALIFLSEFSFEWWHARDRRKYVRHNWYYLFAAVPIPTETFEALHGIRALRLLKLLKIFEHLRYEKNTRLFEKD